MAGQCWILIDTFKWKSVGKTRTEKNKITTFSQCFPRVIEFLVSLLGRSTGMYLKERGAVLHMVMSQNLSLSLSLSLFLQEFLSVSQFEGFDIHNNNTAMIFANLTSPGTSDNLDSFSALLRSVLYNNLEDEPAMMDRIIRISVSPHLLKRNE